MLKEGTAESMVDLRDRHFSCFHDLAKANREAGEHLVLGEADSYWIQHGRWAMVRSPVWERRPPSVEELDRVLSEGRVLVATYLRGVDADHPVNGFLYLYEGEHYDRAKIRSSARKSLRSSQRFLEFRELDLETLIREGYECYRDTRRRVGLSDSTREEFHQTMENKRRLPGLLIQGAWRENTLAAFLISNLVGDQGEFQQHCSRTELQHLEPNEMLYVRSFEVLVNERGARRISAGTTSLQQGVNLQGLHWFKTKLGFEAIEVHRAFHLHPILRVLVNRSAYGTLRTVCRLAPRNKLLRKGLGMFALALGENPLADFAEGKTPQILPEEGKGQSGTSEATCHGGH